MRVSVDTSLWVYRLDRREPRKATFIADWLRNFAREHDIVVSIQVLIELLAVLMRKFKPPLPADDTRLALEALAAFDVVATDTHMVLDAHELALREQLSRFDALIVEAAIRSHCDPLFSEDLSHGRQFGSPTVHNPLVQA